MGQIDICKAYLRGKMGLSQFGQGYSGGEHLMHGLGDDDRKRELNENSNGGGYLPIGILVETGIVGTIFFNVLGAPDNAISITSFCVLLVAYFYILYKFKILRWVTLFLCSAFLFGGIVFTDSGSNIGGGNIGIAMAMAALVLFMVFDRFLIFSYDGMEPRKFFRYALLCAGAPAMLLLLPGSTAAALKSFFKSESLYAQTGCKPFAGKKTYQALSFNVGGKIITNSAIIKDLSGDIRDDDTTGFHIRYGNNTYTVSAACNFGWVVIGDHSFTQGHNLIWTPRQTPPAGTTIHAETEEIPAANIPNDPYKTTYQITPSRWCGDLADSKNLTWNKGEFFNSCYREATRIIHERTQPARDYNTRQYSNSGRHF
jgi:hypothetical protein